MKTAAKAFVERYRAHPARFLLGACYGLWLLGLVALHVVQFAQNRAEYASGVLQPAALRAGDFTLYELAGEGNVFISTGGDPQLRLNDEGRKVENVLLDIVYEGDPGAATVFWAAPGEDFSVRNMAHPAAPGGSVFYLPAAGVRGLRIDPANLAGVKMEVRGVYVNAPRPVWAFFAPSETEWLLFAAIPGLAAAGIAVCTEGLRALRAWRAARKGAGRNG